VREKNGPDADWLTGEFDTEATYKAGGGVPHGRYMRLCNTHFVRKPERRKLCSFIYMCAISICHFM
jgi:hypothetical protein